MNYGYFLYNNDFYQEFRVKIVFPSLQIRCYSLKTVLIWIFYVKIVSKRLYSVIFVDNSCQIHSIHRFLSKLSNNHVILRLIWNILLSSIISYQSYLSTAFNPSIFGFSPFITVLNRLFNTEIVFEALWINKFFNM